MVITGGVKSYFITHADFGGVVTKTQPESYAVRQERTLEHLLSLVLA